MTVISNAFAWMMHQYFGFDTSSVVMGASILVLLVLQIRGTLMCVRQMRNIEDDMDGLRAANYAVRRAVEEAKTQLADITAGLARKTEAQERKLVGELQIIEGLIRDFAAAGRNPKDRGTAEPRMLTATPGEQTDTATLEIIRRALEENRVDLYLQPVVSLPQRKVRFYEGLSRLRSEDGAVIMPEQYIRIAAPAGLMSVVDNLLLFRCVQIVRRLTQRQRDVAVFCNISGHTLNDAEFFPQFLDFMHHHRDLAGQIIFEFSQDSVLAGGPAQEANLRYLANLGFRLSMDQVSRLDFDLARARRLGFQFMKVCAATLLSGMKDARAPVAAEDLKDLLARNGLNLIVERVENEKTVVQLLEFNVGFGQGYLFGEPRAIREIAEANDPRAPAPPPNASIIPHGLARRLAG